jgi:hypothetical protein
MENYICLQFGISFSNLAFDQLKNISANEKIIRMGDQSLKQNPTKVGDFYYSYLLDQSVILTTIISINCTGTYTFGSRDSAVSIAIR